MSARPAPTVHGDRKVYTVADVAAGVAGWLRRLPEVWVEGEVAEVRRNARWQTVYLTLKDAGGRTSLPACMPRSLFDRLERPPGPGERVHALARPALAEARGEFMLRVRAIEPLGLGDLLAEVERVRRRLAAEGLFAAERKRPLPFLPRAVGLVCGSDAAAKRDVVETAARRWPPVRFEIAEAAVQGPTAVVTLIAALRRLDRHPQVDVIVLARGGGSVEDLLPFSDERLCRAVAACATPVVSAIGHEQDSPLVDLAADVRAGTPSLAARAIVPDHAATSAELSALLARAARALEGAAERARRSLDALATRPALADPRAAVAARRAAVDALGADLDRLPRWRLERERARLDGARDRLRLLGPGATLDRGYAIVRDAAGAILRDAGAAAPGDPIGVVLARGRLAARVERSEP